MIDSSSARTHSSSRAYRKPTHEVLRIFPATTNLFFNQIELFGLLEFDCTYLWSGKKLKLMSFTPFCLARDKLERVLYRSDQER